MIKNLIVVMASALVLVGNVAAQKAVSPESIIRQLSPKHSRALCGNLSINLTINFEFNSFLLTSQGAEQARNLGAAIQSDDLKGQKFGIIGHTDLKGSVEYNQLLSEKRALAVKQFLINEFNVKADALIDSGKGKLEPLENEQSPYADRKNRRVQIVNLSSPSEPCGG
ncbi:OmpA family protein [Undibacterium sp. Di24W]|uniref:OmpA family protein n=1 Tax=Undibacterium sp. Di24W TaxID=3413033 RepID=UPI003BF21367